MFVEIDGDRIAYTEAGSPSKPPILWLHGITSHLGVWTRTIEELQNDFHCIAIDHLGFGRSDKPKGGDYSIAKQAVRALKVADHFGFDRFILSGHSMGGQIAAYLAIHLAPQRVSKLISVSGVVTGKLSPAADTPFRRAIFALAEKFPAIYSQSKTLSESWRGYAYWAFGPWFYDIRSLPFDAWELDRRMALNPELAASLLGAWRSLNATDLTSAVKNIAAPTLILFGKQDHVVPVSHARLFKRELPAAQLVLLEQCGHFPMYEKFDEYIQPLQNFLMQ